MDGVRGDERVDAALARQVDQSLRDLLPAYALHALTEEDARKGFAPWQPIAPSAIPEKPGGPVPN